MATVLILSVILGPAPGAAAQEGPIRVVAQSVESHFPDDLTFRLRARSDAGDIVRASLILQVGWDETVEMVVPEPFAPAPEVELSAVWRTANRTVPPFIEITYHWQVTDSSGASLTTEPVRAEYIDSSHDWQRLEDDHVVVLWYDRPASFGEALFEAARQAYDDLSRVTGTSPGRPIRVVIYRDQEDYCAFYAPQTCQDWLGGQTFSGITVQWGTGLDWFTADVIPHEMAHVFYSEIFRDTYVSIPTWFLEGLATYNEPDVHDGAMALVWAAAEEGKLKTLPVMTRGGSVVGGETHVWYAIAYSLVAFLAETYGEETLGDLILTVADNVPFEEALRQTTGLDMAQLEMAWRDWLGYPVDSVPTPMPFPTMPGVTIVPPTAVRGEPAATAPATVAPTSPAQPQEEGHDLLCLGPLAIPLVALAGWGLGRRRAARP